MNSFRKIKNKENYTKVKKATSIHNFCFSASYNRSHDIVQSELQDSDLTLLYILSNYSDIEKYLQDYLREKKYAELKKIIDDIESQASGHKFSPINLVLAKTLSYLPQKPKHNENR